MFVSDRFHDVRKVYAPDGTDLSGRDAKTMGEAAGIRWASYGSGNKWESSIAGKYHFTVRMGNHRETVTVQVVE